jgi:FemAB-related protein (PEP-CTERM system-associated)
MRIVDCDDTFTNAWNAFVHATPDGSLYHRYEWRAINRSLGHRSSYLAALDGDRIAGVLPVVQVKSHLFGNIACSLPFVNYGGPCAENADIERALLEAATGVADRWRADYLELRTKRHLGEQFPTSEHKVSMTVALRPDPEALFATFERTHRKDIRRAYKEGFSTRFGGLELVDDLYAVLSETWRDLGTPIYSKAYLQSVLRAFPDSTFVCVVSAGDDLAAASLQGFQNGTAEGLWLGTRQKYRQQMAGYVLYWELLKRGCELGLHTFHLGRSTANSTADTFKRKWNAEATQLYWQYVLRTRREIPQLNVMNSKYRLAINTWRKLPLGLTQRIGPMIARSIP